MDKQNLRHKCRIYLDIEYYPRNEDERRLEKDIIDAVFAELSSTIETLTGVTPSRENTLRILTSHNKQKVSLHVHMINVGHFASVSKLTPGWHASATTKRTTQRQIFRLT